MKLLEKNVNYMGTSNSSSISQQIYIYTNIKRERGGQIQKITAIETTSEGSTAVRN
jgi:hypothetical protein